MKGKGILAQMRDIGTSTDAVATNSFTEDILNAVFDTDTPPGPRMMWYAQIGWLKFEKGKVATTDDINEQPTRWRSLTDDESHILNNAFK